MFDCVLPTRSGRTGQALTRRGAVNLKNARHADDPRPLDPDCGCPCCRSYERAYLHHVFKAGEIIAAMLLTWHNLHYYQELMAGLRAAIAAGRLAAFVAGVRGAAGGGRPGAGLSARPAVLDRLGEDRMARPGTCRWEGGCRCGEVRLGVTAAAARHHGLPLHRLPADDARAPSRSAPPSRARASR